MESREEGKTYCHRHSRAAFGSFRARANGRWTLPNPSSRSCSVDLMRIIRLALLAVAALALVAFSAATFGVFRNETDSTVIVTIVNARGESSRAHVIQPHDVARFPVTNGTAIARTTSGKTLARCNLMPLPVAREFYDFPNRSFYYRITRARIQLVRPEMGVNWSRSGLTNR